MNPRKSSTQPIGTGSRSNSKSRKENTPGKNPLTLISKNPILARHRPSNSHSVVKPSAENIADRIAQLLKDDFPKKGPKLSESPSYAPSKTSTPKNADRRAASSARHSRASSLNDRPLSMNKLKKPTTEHSHRRKHSIGSDKSLPLVTQFSHISNKGYIPENPNKTNQDNYFEHTNFANYSDLYLFGVCDGHGFYGGEVSGYVKQRLPEMLKNDSNIYTAPKKALTTCIIKCNEELSQLDIDVNFSGTTLNVVLIKGSVLYCANVGDSRAVIARQMNDTSKSTTSGRHWMSIVLSRDHKPNDKDEYTRIMSSGGRVESYQDEYGNPLGPARVWLKYQNLPGLAMSRSLGDGVAASVGVSCEPEILEFNMTTEDKFICIGSDGIFEFIQNEEIVKIVVPFWRLQDTSGACKAMAKEAHDRWCREEEVIDDITALCIFLNIP